MRKWIALGIILILIVCWGYVLDVPTLLAVLWGGVRTLLAIFIGSRFYPVGKALELALLNLSTTKVAGF